MKTCNSCNIVKDLNEFYKKTSSKDGLESRCKECHNLAKECARQNKVSKGLIKPKKKDMLDEAVKSGLLECLHCNSIKRLTEFKKDKSKRIGYRQVCLDCYNKYNKDFFWNQSEDKIESRREYARNFAKANRGVYTAQVVKRRLKQRLAVPKWATTELEDFAILELYDKSKRLGEITGKVFHVDHIVPIVSDFVCGLHCLSNLQILESTTNLSKSNRYWPDMP